MTRNEIVNTCDLLLHHGPIPFGRRPIGRNFISGRELLRKTIIIYDLSILFSPLGLLILHVEFCVTFA